jgi:crotonobetainyl-CoA:carnitine CoA-transferase CaiB-like acyl-CoA transferase
VADRQPLQAGGSIAEGLTGAFAAAATLTAILGRESHGQGDHIDASAQQAVLCGALFPSLRFEYSGDMGARNSRYGPGPSYILPASDGYIGINVLTPDQWQMLCNFLGRPDMAENPDYAGRQRMLRADEIREAFEEAVRERTVEELFHGGEEWRVPFGLVPDMAGIVGMTPHTERGFIVELEHPRAGKVGVPGVPFKSTATDPKPYRPPLLGEHTEEVLAGLNGIPAPRSGASERESLPPPLKGLRVVDLSMYFSGPLATQILGDAGADIIKVESVQRIDGWRGATVASVERPWERSPNFNWVNRSKRGITLNLADPRGQEIVKQLVADADVVIENYTPRVMANFGLTYEALRAVNPRIVMMSMPGFGSDVSWRDYVAFGMSTEQMAGFSHLTGYEGEQPVFTGTNGGDPFVGAIGATALLSALWHRELTGEGQHIDLSQVEACTLFAGDAVTAWTLAGYDPGRTGNRHRTRAPHGIYPCAGEDSWIAIDCQTDEQWRTLAGCIGRPEWAEPGSAFARVEGRMAGRKEIDAAIAVWTKTKERMPLMEGLQAAGVPAGALYDGPDLLADTHLAAREAFIAQDRDNIGVKHYPAQPYRFLRAERVLNQRAPYLGEHTNEVLRESLGMGDEELAALEAADVIGTVPVAARGLG